MIKPLLLTDAIINLVLGILLVFYPDRLVRALGLPVLESAFYASVLGGVLLTWWGASGGGDVEDDDVEDTTSEARVG